LVRLYALVAAAAYTVTALFGGLLYPRYRYFVRGLQLDRDAPWASNLFDFKENLATLGRPLAIGALIVPSGLRHGDTRALQNVADRRLSMQLRWIYGCMAIGTALVSVFNIIAGLIVTGVRGG